MTNTRWAQTAERVGITWGLIFASVAFSAAHWLWPWLGPKLLQPCPLPTVACQFLLAVVGLALGRHWAIGVLVEMEVKRRRPETIQKAIKDVLGGAK